MREIRRLPIADRCRTHVQGRLLDQAEWYRGSAVRHQTTGQRLSWAALGGEALAVTAAVLTLQVPGIGQLGLIGVFGAGTAALTAWAQVGRHDEAAKAYGLAYQELLLIGSLADGVVQEADLGRLVSDGENAISREHTMWVAKRSELATPERIEALQAEALTATVDAAGFPDPRP